MNIQTSSPVAPAREGMGAIVHDGGVAFRVWAPNATAVAVTGDWNDWSEDADAMTSEEGGYWYAEIPRAGDGDEYRFRIEGPDGVVSRIDPHARAVTNSVGNGIVTDGAYDWDDESFEMPPWNALVTYELHLGTFSRPEENGDAPGGFADAVGRFEHLRRLGINAIQIMPAMEFAGDVSWGYNPAHIFAVESAYGGPAGFKDFVKAAHAAGFAVIFDVVYNHFGPSDLDLWRFDGHGEAEAGGVYFYQDHRAATPWGETRPDYGRPEVRRFIRDNALCWLEEFRVDGLRFDMTLYIRTISGDEGDALPDGWSLMAWINDEIAERFPGRITIAEDLRQLEAITAPTSEGGAGFGAQWDAAFVHPVREALILSDYDHRSIGTLAEALTHSYNRDPFRRVVYTESHDEVANGKARVPAEIGGEHSQDHRAAQKRSVLGAALVMTAPGIPMLFQGQEFLQGDWFDDTVPLDWDQAESFRGIVRLWRDLIRLRLDRDGGSSGLQAREVDILMADAERKLLAYHRHDGGEEGGVVVILNFRGEPAADVALDMPGAGPWRLRLNTDWSGYSPDFDDHHSTDIIAAEGDREVGRGHAVLSIGPWSALIYTR